VFLINGKAKLDEHSIESTGCVVLCTFSHGGGTGRVLQRQKSPTAEKEPVPAPKQESAKPTRRSY